MSNKILLAVDEKFIDDYISCMWDSSMQQPHLNNAIKQLNEDVEQAKLDAQELIKQAKNDLIDEILLHECEMYNHLRHRVVKIEDIIKIKEKL